MAVFYFILLVSLCLGLTNWGPRVDARWFVLVLWVLYLYTYPICLSTSLGSLPEAPLGFSSWGFHFLFTYLAAFFTVLGIVHLLRNIT